MTETRSGRGLILLAVLAAHVAFVALLLREDRQGRTAAPARDSEGLLILPIGRPRTAVAKIVPEPAAKPRMPPLELMLKIPDLEPDAAATVIPEELPPPIDWEREAEIATQNALKDAETRGAYRDLSALSPAQLSWVRENHFEPAAPGIPWKYRRVEVTEGGFPIIHINDHCIVVPLLMMMVFCKIGHIEPRGDLFEHMRDAHR
jgi:hypothetical protein